MTRNLDPQRPHAEVYTFDLGNIFPEAVWLGQALGNSPPAFDPDVQAGLGRLFLVINPWRLWFGVETQFDDNTTGPGIFRAVDFSPECPPSARTAIKTLATALVCFNSGEDWHQRGRERLRSATWLLWHSLSPQEQERSRQFLSDAVRLWELPTDEAGRPLGHDGPLVRSENDIGGSVSPHLRCNPSIGRRTNSGRFSG